MESLLAKSTKSVARKFSVDEYYRMAEAGILRPKERVELLDGQILCMAPIGDNHQDLVDTLSEILPVPRRLIENWSWQSTTSLQDLALDGSSQSVIEISRNRRRLSKCGITYIKYPKYTFF